MSVHHLYYYAAPGRAEQIRLALHVAGLQWEDHAVTYPSWQEKKATLVDTVPEANIPLLEVDGHYLAESSAILRYVGNVGNLIPASALDQHKMDAGMSITNDVFSALFATFSIQDQDEKIAARQALCTPDGALYKVLQKMDAMIARFSNGYMAGDMLTVGDLAWFSSFGLLVCGMLDGIDRNIFDSFPNITTYRKFIGTNPKVASRYENETEGMRFNGFKF